MHQDYYDRWKTNILITKEDVTAFGAMVKAYDAGMPREMISTIAILPYWKASMRFLIFEKDGFPGKMILEGDPAEEKWAVYPKPPITLSGWPLGITDIVKKGDILLHTILRAARDTGLIQGPIFRGLQARITSLDAFLGDIYDATNAQDRWISIGDRIDTLWSALLYFSGCST